MRCPICGEASLIHEIRDVPDTYKGKSRTISGIEGDFCPACNEGVLSPKAIERFGQLAYDFQKEVNVN